MRSHRQHSSSRHDARRRAWPWCVLVACVLLLTAPVGSAQATPIDPVDPPVSSPAKAAGPLAGAPSFAPRGTMSKVTRPYVVTLDPTTDTLYVAGRRDPARLFVLDARGCTVQQAQCRGPQASISMGAAVIDIAVDPGTVYVASANGTPHGFVAVVDGRHCTTAPARCTWPTTTAAPGTGGWRSWTPGAATPGPTRGAAVPATRPAASALRRRCRPAPSPRG